ncbi:cbb3-type cytochrome oxidase subunit 3 [Flocculibacter collagenilyticus]|uniref:cbb3-type cytochrome oxidase subunit 3 n=1 Tax=Flocculibacter collagenilyticus TaxID=2744479 RepID=UPI0018F51088|nr:cbb3-type cytochrome c oxidase subunit 3 [Flocculibacter collagenilyticus]
MDYGTFRGVFTLVLLVLFIAIAVWAYSKRRKNEFDEAANLVFDDEDKHKKAVAKDKQESEND